MGHFRLHVSEVSWLPSGIGPVVSGIADEGSIRLNDELELRGLDGTRRRVTLRGIEAAGRVGLPPHEGLALQLLLGDDLTEHDVLPGQVLVTLHDEGPTGVREPRRPSPSRTPPTSATAVSPTGPADAT